MPTALITGASTGIGRELAQIAATNNYDVILTARTEQSLHNAANDIERTTNRKAHIFPIDLAQPNAAQTLFDEIAHKDLTIDILINNAGFGLLGNFWQQPEDEQIQMINLNIGALTQLTRLVLPGMIERHKGYIMNVASTAAFQPGPLMAMYYASKAYVLSFSEAIHNETKGTGVKISCLCPGATRTEFQKRAKMQGTKLSDGSFVMTAQEVAKIGWDGMMRGKHLVIAGHMNAALAFSTRLAPRQMAASIARALQEKR